MESTKFGIEFCQDIKENKKSRKLGEAVFTFLEQCATDIRDVLIALERLKDRNITKCIRYKLPYAETNVLGQFFARNTIAIDRSNAGQFADFVRQNRPLMLGYSQLMSERGEHFVKTFDFFSEIIRSKFDFENFIEKTLEVKPPSKEKQISNVKEPLMWGKVDAKTYQKLYNQKKLEVLLEKKAMQTVAYNSMSMFYNLCYQDMQKEIERTPVNIMKDKEDFVLKKEHILEEIEKEEELFESKLTLAVKDEEDLRKEKEKTDNALFIIIDRYDAEIGDKQDMYEDLVDKQTFQTKRLDKLKRKARMQDLEYERALDKEVQWEIQDLEKELSKLKLMIAHRFLEIFLTAYVQTWRKEKLEKSIQPKK